MTFTKAAVYAALSDIEPKVLRLGYRCATVQLASAPPAARFPRVFILATRMWNLAVVRSLHMSAGQMRVNVGRDCNFAHGAARLLLGLQSAIPMHAELQAAHSIILTGSKSTGTLGHDQHNGG